MQDNFFANNLRLICAETGPIAQICRDIGINRQQFNRYLSGQTTPSAYTLRRICRHFGLSEAEMFVPSEEFSDRLFGQTPLAQGHPSQNLLKGFKGAALRLRRYLGHYHAHFLSPSWQGKILRALVTLREVDNFVVVRSRENFKSPDSSLRLTSRYSGLATLRNSRIYVIEREQNEEGAYVESVFFPAHRQQIRYLRGMTIGVAWRPRLMPYTTRTIWRRLGAETDPRQAIEDCGVFAQNSPKVDPVVRKFLTATEAEDFGHGQYGDFF